MKSVSPDFIPSLTRNSSRFCSEMERALDKLELDGIALPTHSEGLYRRCVPKGFFTNRDGLVDIDLLVRMTEKPV